MNRQTGKSIRVSVKFKEKELELLDKKRKNVDRSSYIRAKSLA